MNGTNKNTAQDIMKLFSALYGDGEQLVLPGDVVIATNGDVAAAAENVDVVSYHSARDLRNAVSCRNATRLN